MHGVAAVDLIWSLNSFPAYAESWVVQRFNGILFHVEQFDHSLCCDIQHEQNKTKMEVVFFIRFYYVKSSISLFMCIFKVLFSTSVNLFVVNGSELFTSL